ncbi:MAG: CRISPR-associated protein Cas2 [Chromatiaceae bacterium]|nr:CRISPR-associated protein Cas2 [Chromatiaceae bacterium]
MAIHKPQTFLLAYDIADPERLVRVHRSCKQWGVPIQYSVFLVPLTPAGMRGLIAGLRSLIDERADDIRVYPIPARAEIEQYGRQGLPEGIELVGGRFGGEKIAALAARGRRKRLGE